MPIPDLFRIDIFPDDDTPPIIYEEVFLDQLVSMIDEAVEKTENYEKRICDEHGFIIQTWISNKSEHRKTSNPWKRRVCKKVNFHKSRNLADSRFCAFLEILHLLDEHLINVKQHF